MSLLDQPVSAYCTRSVVSTTPDTPISTAIKLMHSAKVTSVLICEGNLPVGIVTSRDLPKIFKSDAYHADRPVIEIMTSPVEHCNENDLLLDTLDMMINNGYRHIPVVDSHNNLCGIISETDIMNSLGFYDPTRPRQVDEVMNRSISTTHSETPLSEIMVLFNNRQLECLVISDDSIPLGIITERDLSGLLTSGLAAETPAKVFMSTPAITIPASSGVQHAIQTMHESHIHHLIIVDEHDTICGIVSRSSFLRDLTRFLIRQLVKSEKMIQELTKG